MKKVVFITGASSGIGYRLAKLFLENDYIVCNGSRRGTNEQGIIDYKVDVTKSETIDMALDHIYQEYKRIDILVNCAGFSMAAPIEEVLEKDYKYLFDVNLFGAIYATKKVIPIMKQNSGGRIINISSIGGVIPISYDPYYSASKAALDMFAVALATEISKYNIKVSSVLPGGTKTPFTFARKVYPSSDTDLKKAAFVLAKMEQEGMSAEKVAAIVFQTAVRENPPLIVSCGLTNKIFYLSSKILPTKIYKELTRKVFKVSS